MSKIELFPTDQIVGVFKGFTQGGLEFHADLILPYKNEFQNLPMHGQFLLVQLETAEEAVLGRITSFCAEGKLSSDSGEEFNIRALRDKRDVPEDLREQYLKYRVDIRVLGVVRKNSHGKLTFVPSHRRLPHVGSKVAFLSGEVLKEIASHNIDGASIGHFALGEYIYAEKSKTLEVQDWMQLKAPEILIKFPIDKLVSRRSFVFARAGFGKSNLNKLLFSKLYESTPTVTKKGDKKVPVGTVIFDPDGEYFWPDDKGRPGLCDVPALQDKVVVFTSRRNKSKFYQSFVAGGIKLDIRRLKPADVIAIALSPDKQEQQNVRKLKGLPPNRWEELVNLIDNNGNSAALEDVSRILELKDSQEAEALAARANMTAIIRMIHDRTSQMMDLLIHALSEGKLCIVDVSQMRGGQALILSGLILRRIFDRNQQEFTEAEPKTIPTIAVVEEAQSVLNENATSAEPYITWVKEGRKYDLGALLITQQPGSIPVEILSQGDNWFIFHLLSMADLSATKKANAHFSEDLLSGLLNEPIKGQGVFWSSEGGTPYPLPIRVLSFEHLFKTLDPHYNKAAVDTYAKELRKKFDEMLQKAIKVEKKASASEIGTDAISASAESEKVTDPKEIYENSAIEALKNEKKLIDSVKGDGAAYGAIKAFLLSKLPSEIENRDEIAYALVPKALNAIFGTQNEEWHSFRNSQRDNKTYVKTGKKSS
jgi:hypothetical protein